MAKIVIVQFPSDQGEQFSLVHRLRNFGEDVFRFLRDYDWGTLDIQEVDAATTNFMITGVKASKLRRLTDWIEREAARQHLRVTIEVR